MNERAREVEERVERRRHYRAGMEAGAVIHAAQMALRGRIVDLSLGGVRVRRVDENAPCPSPGTVAMVELELGTGRGWVAQDGHIHRCELGEIVIAFGPLAAEVEDLIEDEVLAAIEATRRPRMIVVDPSADRRRKVADKLREAGCESYEAATPLEAIELLERPRSHISGMTMAEHLTQTGTDEFSDFVAETNPNIKLALITEALADGTVDQPLTRNQRVTDRMAAVVPEDTLEISLRGFVDAATRPSRR
jgi:CheY-like chemotaxis protein